MGLCEAGVQEMVVMGTVTASSKSYWRRRALPPHWVGGEGKSHVHMVLVIWTLTTSSGFPKLRVGASGIPLTSSKQDINSNMPAKPTTAVALQVHSRVVRTRKVLCSEQTQVAGLIDMKSPGPGMSHTALALP